MSEVVARDLRLNKLPENILAALNRRISQAINENVASAVSLAVFHYDSPILDVAWGWLDPEEQTMPTQTKTLFDLASVTKVYTTVALLSLISEKKVYLHSPLVNIIPEFGTGGMREIGSGQDPYTKEMLPIIDGLAGQKVDPVVINNFHLLTHTSGLPAWRAIYDMADAPKEMDTVSREERWSRAVEMLCKINFVNLPEIGITHSDIGMMLLGEAVARLHSKSGELDNAIEERVLGDRFSNTVFNPLSKGFTREQLAPTEDDRNWRKRRIWGEVNDENASEAGGVAGHAGLFATAFEVGLFGNVWLNHSEKILKIDPELAGASVELQAQTGNAVQGLGWMLKSPQNSSCGDLFSSHSYGHTGSTGTSLWIDPQEKLVVALLTNSIYHSREQDTINNFRRDVHDILSDFVQG